MANIKFTIDSFFVGMERFWVGSILAQKHSWGEQLQVFVHMAGLCGQGKCKHVFTQLPGTLPSSSSSSSKTKSVSPIPEAQESGKKIPSTKRPSFRNGEFLVREFIFPEINDDHSGLGEFVELILLDWWQPHHYFPSISDPFSSESFTCERD